MNEELINLIDMFQNDKFNEIFKLSEEINKKKNIINSNKDNILNNLKKNIREGNRNINNIINRLYIIDNLLNNIKIEMEDLNNDIDINFNLDIDNRASEILKDQNYSRFIMKPFLPYILMYSIINMDKFVNNTIDDLD